MNETAFGQPKLADEHFDFPILCFSLHVLYNGTEYINLKRI